MEQKARAIARAFSRERAWSRGEVPANFTPYDSLLNQRRAKRVKAREALLPEAVRQQLKQKRDERQLEFAKEYFSKARSEKDTDLVTKSE